MYAPASTTAADVVCVFVTRGWKGSTTCAATELGVTGVVGVAAVVTAASFDSSIGAAVAVAFGASEAGWASLETSAAAVSVGCPKRAGRGTRDAMFGCTATMPTEATTARDAAAAVKVMGKRVSGGLHVEFERRRDELVAVADERRPVLDPLDVALH
tara:strand:- start:18629 stop:19099 length:471 start_codon:yes stop_codon:yes gene_type:complete